MLAQIIFEQEGIEGQSLLPITFLRQIIRFYGDSMQALLPSYLEFSIDRFTGEQQKMREAATPRFGNDPFADDLVRRARGNDAQEPCRVHPGARPCSRPSSPARRTPADAPRSPPPASADLDDLRAQLTEMKRRLDDIAEKN